MYLNCQMIVENVSLAATFDIERNSSGGVKCRERSGVHFLNLGIKGVGFKI